MRPEDEYKIRSERKGTGYFSLSQSNDPHISHLRERHGCLTVWLYLYVIFAVVSFCLLVPYLERLMRFNFLPTLVLLVSIVTEGVSAYYVLQWKRWAVNALVASIILSFLLEMVVGVAQFKDIIQLAVSLGILAYFVQPHLEDYE